MSCGFIYIASNNVGGIKENDYISEAIFSAKSLKKYNPKVNITLITDKKIDNKIFDNIIIEKLSLRCKQYFLFDKTPYEKNIYIDTDTKINDNIMHLFDLMEKFDVIAVNDYARKRILPIPEYMEIPEGFSEVNGGVFGFKKNDKVKKMFDLWVKYYNKYIKVLPWDQPSFRIALWKSDVNLYLLPLEYNRRGKHTKQKCINCRKNRDSRFPSNHLNTKIYHFHGLENMSSKEMEEKAQDY